MKSEACVNDIELPSVLWHCWLDIRKNIQPIKITDEMQA